MKQFILCLLAISGMSGCTFSQLVYSFVPVPSAVAVDQVHWQFENISSTGCPDLSGTYFIESSKFSGGLGSGIPGLAFGPPNVGGEVDVELTIVGELNGFTFNSKYQGLRNQNRIAYSELFGCQEGYIVYRSVPSILRDGESGDCSRVINHETHLALNSSGELVASIIKWDRCWLERFSESSSDDVGPQVHVYPRIK